MTLDGGLVSSSLFLLHSDSESDYMSMDGEEDSRRGDRKDGKNNDGDKRGHGHGRGDVVKGSGKGISGGAVGMDVAVANDDGVIDLTVSDGPDDDDEEEDEKKAKGKGKGKDDSMIVESESDHDDDDDDVEEDEDDEDDAPYWKPITYPSSKVTHHF